MTNSPLLRFESFVRRLVEQPFAWLSGDSIDPFGMATNLLQLLQAEQGQGRQVAQFTIYVNPALLDANRPDKRQLAEMVSAYITLLAERTGTPLTDPPAIRIEEDPTVGTRVATVVVNEEVLSPNTDTQLLPYEAIHTATEAIHELDAYLIVQGRQHAPLDHPVIRIGRHTDNDIVLDSPAVSRHHAQVRWRDSYFVLFDTSTHRRTIVNGDQVQEHILRPGDVIALSDTLLIYGEERAIDEPREFETAPASPTLLKPTE